MYFDQLLGAARTEELVALLFFSRFQPFLFISKLFQWFQAWNVWKWTKNAFFVQIFYISCILFFLCPEDILQENYHWPGLEEIEFKKIIAGRCPVTYKILTVSPSHKLLLYDHPMNIDLYGHPSSVYRTLCLYCAPVSLVRYEKVHLQCGGELCS